MIARVDCNSRVCRIVQVDVVPNGLQEEQALVEARSGPFGKNTDLDILDTAGCPRPCGIVNQPSFGSQPTGGPERITKTHRTSIAVHHDLEGHRGSEREVARHVDGVVDAPSAAVRILRQLPHDRGSGVHGEVAIHGQQSRGCAGAECAANGRASTDRTTATQRLIGTQVKPASDARYVQRRTRSQTDRRSGTD